MIAMNGDDPLLEPFFGPKYAAKKTKLTTRVRPTAIKPGSMLLVKADANSTTSLDDCPFDICKVTSVPAAFAEEPADTPLPVEFYAADRCGP